MNKALLASYMIRYGDTQKTLSAAMGISLSRFNAKINRTGGADFRQSELAFIARRYALTPEEIHAVFFAQKVS